MQVIEYPEGAIPVRVIWRAQRQGALLHRALEAFEALDRWDGEHPEAIFGEMEQQAREQRRELMG